MTLLAAYDRLRAALAEAKDVGQVIAIRDELEHVKLYAKQIQDRELLIEATRWQLKTERRLGQVLLAAKNAGQIGDGRPKENGSRITLEDIGVNRKLSSKSQKIAALDDDEFEQLLSAVRDKIQGGRAIVIDPTEDGAINGARAVMSARTSSDSLDYFPTPPWATRALIEHALPQLGDSDLQVYHAWEPACGEGHIAEVLKEYFGEVRSTDIFDYGYGEVLDFLGDAEHEAVDWIITNPPFGDAGEAFVHAALELSHVGIAMFMRVQWLDSIGRYERVFRDKPPTLIAFFAERVNLCKGRWDPEGGTATAYMWLVWKHGIAPRAPFWIPPGCREQLAHPDDVARFTAHPVVKRILVAA